jgi:RNA polymerase-binding transcription factor DksA
VRVRANVALGTDATAARVLVVDDAQPTAIDLDAIETDLADVEIALARLEAGTYWTCDVTGQPLPAELLDARPTARHLPPRD